MWGFWYTFTQSNLNNHLHNYNQLLSNISASCSPAAQQQFLKRLFVPLWMHIRTDWRQNLHVTEWWQSAAAPAARHSAGRAAGSSWWCGVESSRHRRGKEPEKAWWRSLFRSAFLLLLCRSARTRWSHKAVKKIQIWSEWCWRSQLWDHADVYLPVMACFH